MLLTSLSVRGTGSTNLTKANRSPCVLGSRRWGIPLPHSRKHCPALVRGGIFNNNGLSRVEKRVSPPAIAVKISTGTSMCKSWPSRSKVSLGKMCTSKYRSPAGPLLCPDSPCPDRRTREPVRTPGGIAAWIRCPSISSRRSAP